MRSSSCLGGEHSAPLGRGNWNIAPDAELGIYIKCNGSITYAVRCGFCGEQSSSIPKKLFSELVNSGRKVMWHRNEIGEVRCVVRNCNEPGYEYHHFAPQNVFPDFDDWPYEPLCHKHHEYWHQSMDGYQWHSPRRSSRP